VGLSVVYIVFLECCKAMNRLPATWPSPPSLQPLWPTQAAPCPAPTGRGSRAQALRGVFLCGTLPRGVAPSWNPTATPTRLCSRIAVAGKVPCEETGPWRQEKGLDHTEMPPLQRQYEEKEMARAECRRSALRWARLASLQLRPFATLARMEEVSPFAAPATAGPAGSASSEEKHCEGTRAQPQLRE
jgi:hypothetical protein